jgi:nucleotide-binding universal stress UspA family protein
MFKRFLVPLDGSTLAESVLPAAQFLAIKFHASILLLHAIEKRAPQTIHGEHHLSNSAEADAYLARLATRLTNAGVPIEKHVHAMEEDDVARSIIRRASELDADLILLCSHGASGMKSVLVGSVAQQVVQHDTTPVFLVRPNQDPDWECRKILVPLDSAEVHEPALPIAAEFARACDASIHPVTVVPTTKTLSGERAAASAFLPTTMNAVLDLAERGAREYIENIARNLSAGGLNVSGSIARGKAANEIVNEAKRARADLIVVATHGRRNIEAFWLGSVTPYVIEHAPCPVLLVRVTGEESAR